MVWYQLEEKRTGAWEKLELVWFQLNPELVGAGLAGCLATKLEIDLIQGRCVSADSYQKVVDLRRNRKRRGWMVDALVGGETLVGACSPVP